MRPQAFVVSNPPHDQVDYRTVASVLGLGVGDAQLKVDFAAPEVLSASDPEPAREVAGSLRAAGLNTVIVDARRLAAIHWPMPVSSFEFREDGLAARIGNEEVVLPYHHPVLGVYCKPPAYFMTGGAGGGLGEAPPEHHDVSTLIELARTGNGARVAEVIQWTAILDLYYELNGTSRRLSIVRELTDFSGLGDQTRPTPGENIQAFVAECTRRFTSITLDTRLKDVRPRQPFRMGDESFDLDMRKLFSYGTLLLRQALATVSPELGDLTQYEFASRIGYVLASGEADAGP